MYRKLIIVACVLALLGLTVTAVFAGRTRLAKVKFSLGSLIAEGVVTGFGKQDVKLTLNAQGQPVVTCTKNDDDDDNDDNDDKKIPGKNPPKIWVTGYDIITKDGSSPFNIEAEVPQLSAKELGCPNNSWTASIDFVFWTNAAITVKKIKNGETLLQDGYTCTTTRHPAGISCTPIDDDEEED